MSSTIGPYHSRRRREKTTNEILNPTIKVWRNKITITLLLVPVVIMLQQCNRSVRLVGATTFNVVAFVNRSSIRSFTSFEKLTTMNQQHQQKQKEEEEEVTEYYDPMKLVKDGRLPMPKALSPSAAMEFRACPQSYMFQYLLGLRQPTNLILTKGIMCHTALEKLFNLDVKDRTIDNLQNLLRRAWKETRGKEEYAGLFGEDAEEKIQNEREWGLSALQLLTNYYQLEDPRLVPPPNPLQREIWVRAHLPLHHTNTHDDDDEEDSFLVRGIVDRLDLIQVPSTSSSSSNNDPPKFGLRIVDYKTGKAPNFKYSPETNARIADEKFWQLKIYALLLHTMMEQSNKLPANLKYISSLVQDQQNETLPIRFLRLMFLTSEDGTGQYVDMDLGETEEERNGILQEVKSDLTQIWQDIETLVSQQDTTAFVHCDRPFCYCHKIRPNFLAGTVWEKGDD